MAAAAKVVTVLIKILTTATNAMQGEVDCHGFSVDNPAKDKFYSAP
jgi:hypothetical protein